MRPWLVFLTLSLAHPAVAAEIEVRDNAFAQLGLPLSLADYLPALVPGYAQYHGVKLECSDRGAALLGPQVMITISGRIEAGDAAAFSAMAEPYGAVFSEEGFPESCGNAVVVLDSHGGELREAIAVGREVARLGLPTVVGPEGSCLSSCVIVLLGGSYAGLTESSIWIFTGANVGIHQPQFDPTDRERQILGLVPEAERIDRSFALAGEEWKSLTGFIINERRNAYLMQRLLDSPQAADQFDYLDTFEELYFAGINPIVSRLAGLDWDALSKVLEESPVDLDAEAARRVCALPAIKEGALSDFSESVATPIGTGWVVGFQETGQFCYAGVRGQEVLSCYFNSTAFRRNGPEPAWIEQWGYGAMGLYPTIMFDFEAGIVDPPTPAEMAEIEAIFDQGFAWGEFCQDTPTWFPTQNINAFARRMRLSADCETPTGLCE